MFSWVGHGAWCRLETGHCKAVWLMQSQEEVSGAWGTHLQGALNSD